MKFNWGTGIFIFLTLFILASVGFMIFAFNQDVNLVHKDYYEKGVDYSEQMKVDSRSVKYKNSVLIEEGDRQIILEFKDVLVSKIDSGTVLLFRPSNSKQDVQIPLEIIDNRMNITKNNLLAGRYIIELNWYSEGLEYEIKKPININ